MTLRRLTLTFAGIALGLSAWTACTGDDPVTMQTGAVGQPCNSGGTCNAPELKCVGAVCQTVSATASSSSTTSSTGGTSSGSSSSSGATSSSSSSSSGDPDAGIAIRLDVTADACEDPLPKAGPYCPGVSGQACANGQACCPEGADHTKCDVPSCAPDLVWTCETKDHCPGSSVCCITAQKKPSPLCTDYDTLYSAISSCKPTNADCKLPEQWKTCTGGGDCDSNDCVRREVITKEGLRIVVHVCEQQF